MTTFENDTMAECLDVYDSDLLYFVQLQVYGQLTDTDLHRGLSNWCDSLFQRHKRSNHVQTQWSHLTKSVFISILKLK